MERVHAHCAAASSTTNSWSAGYSLKIKRRGAGGVSSVMLEKRTILCCLMWDCASDNIICSIGPVGQSCQTSQNFSPFGRSLVPRRWLPLLWFGHSSSTREYPVNAHEMMTDRPCAGGSSHVTFFASSGSSRHILSSLAGTANFRGITTREPTWVWRVHWL